jgi:hypothetical protein
MTASGTRTGLAYSREYGKIGSSWPVGGLANDDRAGDWDQQPMGVSSVAEELSGLTNLVQVVGTFPTILILVTYEVAFSDHEERNRV